MIAPGQFGTQPPDGESFGNSHDRRPLGRGARPRDGDEECFVAADLDLERQDELRERLPSLANRVPAAYRWPEEANA